MTYVFVCLVSQLCPTLYDPMDCSPPGSSAHEFQPQKPKQTKISVSPINSLCLKFQVLQHKILPNFINSNENVCYLLKIKSNHQVIFKHSIQKASYVVVKCSEWSHSKPTFTSTGILVILTSLCLNFLVCKIEMTLIATSIS